MDANEKAALLNLYNSEVSNAFENSKSATNAMQNKNYEWYNIYVEKMRIAQGCQQAIRRTLEILGHSIVTDENGVATNIT